jgi:hypothetical protein
MSMKSSSHIIVNWTRDLLACSAVPQPTVPLSTPLKDWVQFPNQVIGTFFTLYQHRTLTATQLNWLATILRLCKEFKTVPSIWTWSKGKVNTDYPNQKLLTSGRIFYVLLKVHLDILCNDNQPDALFILTLFHQSTSTCFRHVPSWPSQQPVNLNV